MQKYEEKSTAAIKELTSEFTELRSEFKEVKELMLEALAKV